jgi:hypothetical protein
MPNMDYLLREIESLSSAHQVEIFDFVLFLRQKQRKPLPETMGLSEAALAKDWDTPEEDKAWANL